MQKWILYFIFDRDVIESIKKTCDLFVHNGSFYNYIFIAQNMINPNIQNPQNQNKDLLLNTKNELRLQNEEDQILLKLQCAFQNTDFIQLQTTKEQIYQIMSEERKICKTMITVNYILEEVFEYLKQSDNRLSIFQKCVLITQIAKDQNVEQTIQKQIFELQWPHRNRQFIVKMQQKKQDNQCLLVWSSFKKGPINQDYVQGDMKMSGFILSKVEQTKTRVKYIIQATLGEAGQMLIKNFLHTQCQSIWRLQQFMIKQTEIRLQQQKAKQLQMKAQLNKQEDYINQVLSFNQ